MELNGEGAIGMNRGIHIGLIRLEAEIANRKRTSRRHDTSRHCLRWKRCQLHSSHTLIANGNPSRGHTRGRGIHLYEIVAGRHVAELITAVRLDWNFDEILELAANESCRSSSKYRHIRLDAAAELRAKFLHQRKVQIAGDFVGS